MADLSLRGTIIGNYAVGDQIGEGGMGVVYRAEHRRLPRRAAVKVLRPEASCNPELTTRFFNEAVAASGLDSAHVVEVLDYGELPDPDGRAYIVMEWLEGRSLAQVLRDDGALPIPVVLHVLGGICQALSAAHARGIVHRDLKPDNVFLIHKAEDRHFVKVLDFGVAKLTEVTSAAPTSPGGVPSFRTRTGIVIGTPAYMSPEQWRGANLVDHRSDVYSLGLIAYELITGQLPCLHGTGQDQVVAHVYEAAAPPSSLQPEVAPWLDQLVLKALAKDPGERWSSMSELATALESGSALTRPLRVLAPAGLPPRARDDGSGDESARPPREVPVPASFSDRHTTLRGNSGELLAQPGAGAGGDRRMPGWLMPLAAMALVGGAITAAVLLLSGSPAQLSPASLGPPPMATTEALQDPPPEDLQEPVAAVVEPPSDAAAAVSEDPPGR